MKRLSDYEGVEAIELWGDLIDDVNVLISDKEVSESLSGSTPATLTQIAGEVMKKYPKEAARIIERIDDDEINGANIFSKFIMFLTEFMSGQKASAFFKSAGPVKRARKSSGSATGNTGDGLK